MAEYRQDFNTVYSASWNSYNAILHKEDVCAVNMYHYNHSAILSECYQQQDIFNKNCLRNFLMKATQHLGLIHT